MVLELGVVMAVQNVIDLLQLMPHPQAKGKVEKVQLLSKLQIYVWEVDGVQIMEKMILDMSTTSTLMIAVEKFGN